MQAICFDFDGTLIDSEVFHAQNWSNYLASVGGDISQPQFLSHYAGLPWPKVAAEMKNQFSLTQEIHHILHDMEALTREMLQKGHIPAMPGVDNALKQLHGQCPLMVVTGSPREYVEGILERLGWLSLFDGVVTGQDVANNKPSPEIYQLACKQLNEQPDRVIAVEDSLTGITSSLSAGLPTILVNPELPQWNVDVHDSFSSMEEAQVLLNRMIA
ncbi:HAD family hydrolase [Photobacterium kagoshimensis]|uniref:HAD family hydrolase n=1 Tax=Photobacterium kagoshimensis TaxID=2910242 RepID=UPI003D0B6AD1